MSALSDERVGMLTVEQLTAGQWHVIDVDGPYSSGVTNWVDALDRALWTALLNGSGVQSVDLAMNRLTLLHPPVSA